MGKKKKCKGLHFFFSFFISVHKNKPVPDRNLLPLPGIQKHAFRIAAPFQITEREEELRKESCIGLLFPHMKSTIKKKKFPHVKSYVIIEYLVMQGKKTATLCSSC